MPEKAVADPTNIDSILHEQRKFECPAEFSAQAHIKSLADYGDENGGDEADGP